MLNLFSTSSFPKEIIISYRPGPNLDPVKATLNGWPTPLKFVSYFLINSFIIGSRTSLFKLLSEVILLLNSFIIFLASILILSFIEIK